jgi:hypothetical protein
MEDDDNEDLVPIPTDENIQLETEENLMNQDEGLHIEDPIVDIED